MESAEVARPLRLLDSPLGAALLATPFLFEAGIAATVNSLLCGLALIAVSFRRGPIRETHGSWNHFIV